MITATIEGDETRAPSLSTAQSTSVLRSLMRDWEREGAADEDESEVELMILPSGMVSEPAVGDI